MVALLLFLLIERCARLRSLHGCRRVTPAHVWTRSGAWRQKSTASSTQKLPLARPLLRALWIGMSDQRTPRSMATVKERFGEISPLHAVEQAMASARAADGAGDKAASEQALADVQLLDNSFLL
jgi:hypothetical protein